jgi:hypothetical protein
VATFVGGIFWARANRHGAFVTLLLGVGLGVVFFVLNEILGVFAIQFLYAAGVSLVMSVLILVGVSLATEPPPADETEELTWNASYWHAETEALKDLAWWQNYRYHSVLLALCTVVIFYFFARSDVGSTESTDSSSLVVPSSSLFPVQWRRSKMWPRRPPG